MASNPQTQQNLKELTQTPYAWAKYRQYFESLAKRSTDILTVKKFKKFIDYDNKTQFQQEIVCMLLKQVNEFANKAAKREFEKLNEKEFIQENLKLFDQINFRYKIMSDLQEDPFEVFDEEEEFLNQLEAALVKIDQEL